MNPPNSSRQNQLRAIARRAMVERGLVPDFPPAVLAEADSLSRDEPGQALAKPTTTETATARPTAVRDLRSLLWSSIDNDDSRDLDQLSVAEPLSNGLVKVLVAVADVDTRVPRESAIDRHARVNTTSVYTPAAIFSMLPERISTDLTSLNEGQERLAIVVEMLIAPDGTVTSSDVYQAVVFNHAKLAYGGVAAWLESGQGPGQEAGQEPGQEPRQEPRKEDDGQQGAATPPPRGVSAVPGLAEQLRIQDRVAQAMRALRHRNGALRLETSEARVVFDRNGQATDLRAEERSRAKELIEDFMIAANGVIAAYLQSRGFPSLRRVLRSPERWGRIVELAAATGDALPPEPSARALDEFLARRKRASPLRFADLSLSVVKLLGKGEYVVQPPSSTNDQGVGHPGSFGHFGLAVKAYTHSTAPNRRYPDLLTQRLVKAALADSAIPYGDHELASLAQHCTAQENNASKVERQVRKSAAALLLASRIGARWEGIVTGASAKGTWVRIFQPAVEGKIVHGAEGLDVGERVRVELVATDVERGFIDFVRS